MAAIQTKPTPCMGCGRSFPKTRLAPTGVRIRCQDKLKALRSILTAQRSPERFVAKPAAMGSQFVAPCLWAPRSLRPVLSP